MDTEPPPGAPPVDEQSDDELARSLTALARAGEVDGPAWRAAQDELARRRVGRAREDRTPSGPSLRSQILAFLAKTPESTPSQIADELDRSTTVVSRLLAELRKARLVDFRRNEDDGRNRHYRLLDPGLATAANARKSLSATEEERQYIGLVIAAAVRARRKSNRLDYAKDRLRRALDGATKVGAQDLALLARRELVTTLRQSGETAEVEWQLNALAEIAAGTANVDPRLITPASACLSYEYGRQQADPRERMENLSTAATLFRRCEVLDEGHDWAPREGWALLARAEVWRQETEFGAALADAVRAEAIFTAYDDNYGSAEATRMQGFCQRLRGNFHEAIGVLDRAMALAAISSADRSRADILLQRGDALRCIGEWGQAVETLHEAVEVATSLGRLRTLGFSLTHLSAAEYVSGNVDGAWNAARRAESLLGQSDPGRAINTRRLGVIAGKLAAGGDPKLLPQSLQFFDRAMQDYTQLDSPAGIAACCIGIGKSQSAGNDPTPAINALTGVASTIAGRILLPIDPWVPTLVQQWADESSDERVEQVAEWTYTSDKKSAFAEADEMAGEPRVKSKVLAA